MAKATPATQMHHIYEMVSVYNMPKKKVEEATGVSASVIDRIMRAYRTEDLSELKGLCEKKAGGLSMNYFEAACQYRGVDPDKWIEEYNSVTTEEPKEEPAAVAEHEQKISPNDGMWFAKVITCLGITMDEVKDVNDKLDRLTKAVESMSDMLAKTISSNCDVLYGEIRKQTDHLGGIKENTKKLKRSYQE